MNSAMIEVGVSTGATVAVATAVNAEPLLTALIGFGVSLVTVVGGELIKLLVAYLKNKRSKYESVDEKKEGHE